MAEKTNLRQADAKVEVVGLVSELELEESVKDSKKAIKGEVVVQTGDINFVTFSVYVSEKKNDGTDNPGYKGIKTVMDTYKSISKVGREEATKVVINNGRIAPNTFLSKRDGKAHTSMRYQNTFFSTYEGSPENFEPKASFELEMIITSITNETYTTGENKGEETGRVIVKGWMPTYSGIEPITLIAPEEYGVADAILDNYSPNQTVKFYGDIINSRAEFYEEIPVKIGKPIKKKRTIYKDEMIITGASEAYDEDTPIKPYDVEAVRQAITERENKIAEMESGTKVTHEEKITRNTLPNF